MEALGAVGSVVGVVSLGIQLAQILQQQIDSIRGADERVKEIVAELHATAASLGALQALQLRDEQSPANKIFNETGSHAISYVVQRCNFVFRNIVVLVSKAGKEALAVVDDFQRKINRRRPGAKPDAVKLEIELSNLEHLLWPWRLPKIEQYLADLERLKSSLLLLLAVADLAKNKTVNKRSVESIVLGESDREAALVDRIYYRDRTYQKARRKSVRIRSRPFHQNPINRGLIPTVPTAYQLIQNWPDLPDDDGKPSVSDLLQLGIKLEGFSVATDLTAHLLYTRVPVNLRATWEEAIQAQKEPSKSVWNVYATLPAHSQFIIQQVLDDLKSQYTTQRHIFYPKHDDSLTLLSLKIHKNRQVRLFEKLKSFTCFYGPGRTRAHILIVVARVAKPIGQYPSYQQDEDYHGPFNPLYPTSQFSSQHFNPRPKGSEWFGSADNDWPVRDDDSADIPKEPTYHIPSRSRLPSRHAPLARYNSQIDPHHGDYSPPKSEALMLKRPLLSFGPNRPSHIRPLGESRRVTFDEYYSGTRAPKHVGADSYNRPPGPIIINNDNEFPGLHRSRTRSYERIRDPPYNYDEHRRRDQYEGYQDDVTELSSDEELPPTEDEKIALARKYLLKWTTVDENTKDTNSEKLWGQEEGVEFTHPGDIIEIMPRHPPHYRYRDVPEGTGQDLSGYADADGPMTIAGSRDMALSAITPQHNLSTFPHRPLQDNSSEHRNSEAGPEEGSSRGGSPQGRNSRDGDRRESNTNTLGGVSHVEGRSRESSPSERDHREDRSRGGS